MSGRADHAAARWADDGGGEAVGEARATGSGSGEVEESEVDERVEDDSGVEDGRILTDVAALTAQRDEYLESLQRLKADFDNYRKRVARLQQEQAARAEASLIAKLLPVLDNLDLAWAHLGRGSRSADGEPVSEEARALGQARAQMLDALAKEGLERVDAVGVPFDPTVHDAVAHADAAGPGGSDGSGEEDEGSDEVNGSTPHALAVDDVLRAGYRWRGQVLRPAMVRVRG
jgi:molecular chaperone GrpE